MSPLEEATTKELCDELARRHAASVIALLSGGNTEAETPSYAIHLEGASPQVLGLCSCASIMATRSAAKEIGRRVDAEEDEEEGD